MGKDEGTNTLANKVTRQLENISQLGNKKTLTLANQVTRKWQRVRKIRLANQVTI
jgi:hypothetical protein